MNNRVLGPLMATASMLIATGASAQQAEEDAQESVDTGEIVVTAQRRSETLMQVPLAISALSGDQLADRGIREIAQLQATTPGLVVNDDAPRSARQLSPHRARCR